MTQLIHFQAGGCQLEGTLTSGGSRGAVITHPHPLYGGDMNNYVVEAAEHACRQCGMTTLRFNFRGVGRSEGRHEEGLGEREDVRSAIACLSDQGCTEISLLGYSFGAWVNAHVECDLVRRMIMISPPVNFLDFGKVEMLPCLELVVYGDDDEFASTELVPGLVRKWNPGAVLKEIADTDHFYSGAVRDLESTLRDYLKQV